MGNAIGGGLGSAASGAIARGTGLIPRPQGPADPVEAGGRTNAYLDKVYPGTNPWERLGVNASSPTEINAEQGRNQMRVANQQAKVALATNGQQIDAQQKIAAAQLSTQETLKRQELATSKDIAQLQARANIINGLGIQSPESVNPALGALMTGNYSADPSFRGTHRLAQRQTAVQEGQLSVKLKELEMQIQRAPLERKLLVAQSMASKLQSEAAERTSKRSGGQYGTLSRIQNAAIDEFITATQKLPETVKNVDSWLNNQLNRLRSKLGINR